MLPVVANLTLLNVAVAAANPLASVVAVRFAVPSVVVVVLVEELPPQLVPNAITVISAIPRKTVPRRIFFAKTSRNKHAIAAHTSPRKKRLGSGQLRRPGLKTPLV